MELLKAKIKDLERVVSNEKAKAGCEQDKANLAKREAAVYKAKTERLEITTERQTRELEQKTQELKSCHEQLTELKHNTEDAAEASHWKYVADTLASDLKTSTTERIDLLAQLNRVKTAYHESHAEVEELQHALQAAKESPSAAQTASGASPSQPSSPSAAQTSDRMDEQTASGKACDTRSANVKADKENVVPRTPSKSAFVRQALSRPPTGAWSAQHPQGHSHGNAINLLASAFFSACIIIPHDPAHT
ncbi:hypothetical protein L227DRAFT_563215 [Lentinus tigrinus ALCF2SS1-6]|uniref:Uncharacterized protein n=1 Tax=Lentinus tigrinus ALCF2SS1-6 TaxID=1328759 RepID=A0A5C2SA43_9APHY|nr:hypothetical protein L227DRAFT_563215 [Lentinus tigrinus ALCF2SS1-6]